MFVMACVNLISLNRLVYYAKYQYRLNYRLIGIGAFETSLTNDIENVRYIAREIWIIRKIIRDSSSQTF